MNNWMYFFYIFICGIMMALMALGLGAAVIMPGMDRWNKRFFIIFFSVLLTCAIAFFAELLFYIFLDMGFAGVIADCIISFLIAVSIGLLTVYLLHCSGENWRRSPLFYTVLSLSCIYYILASLTPFTSAFVYVTPDYQFHRGSWYQLLILPEILVMILNLTGTLLRSERLPARIFYAFLSALLPLTAALFVNMFIWIFPFIDIGLAIFAIVMLNIILSNHIEQYTREQDEKLRQQQENLRHQEEIATQRANILMLQMRPHFIYNTMTSIYYLCDRDAKKAQEVTMNFITYLRKNFNAIATDHTIPFSEELEHTRTYLAVEQAQFTNRLFVDYDTSYIQFHLPPLTLQPIVENSVKHGMDPDSEPLHISIRTREMESGSEIIVEDNGTGFEPKDNSEPHIALSNIQQRLELMCGGQMEITPRQGGGTIVKIEIPR